MALYCFLSWVKECDGCMDCENDKKSADENQYEYTNQTDNTDRDKIIK